jgi:hypothetical protein
MSRKILSFMALICLLSILVACDSYQIKIDPAEPVVQNLNSQFLEINNCDGLEELNKPLSSELQVSDQIVFEEILTSNNTTYPIPEDLKTQLEEKIKTTYQQISDDAKTDLDQYIISLPADRILTITINWSEKIYKATGHVTFNNMDYTFLYSYALKIPLVGETWIMTCTA